MNTGCTTCMILASAAAVCLHVFLLLGIVGVSTNTDAPIGTRIWGVFGFLTVFLAFDAWALNQLTLHLGL